MTNDEANAKWMAENNSVNGTQKDKNVVDYGKKMAGKAWSGIKGAAGAVAGGTAVGAAAGTAYGMNTKTRKSNTELAMWGAGAGAGATGLYSGRNLIKAGYQSAKGMVKGKGGGVAKQTDEISGLDDLQADLDGMVGSTDAKGSTVNNPAIQKLLGGSNAGSKGSSSVPTFGDKMGSPMQGYMFGPGGAPYSGIGSKAGRGSVENISMSGGAPLQTIDVSPIENINMSGGVHESTRDLLKRKRNAGY